MAVVNPSQKGLKRVPLGVRLGGTSKKKRTPPGWEPPMLVLVSTFAVLDSKIIVNIEAFNETYLETLKYTKWSMQQG